MKIDRRVMQRTPLLLVTLASALALVPPAGAQSWPQRPIRMIVPQGAGASNDTLSRVLAVKLGEVLGQQIVVDNRPGAGGLIGLEIAARAVPDGYTILGTATATQVIAPQLQKKLSFDPFKDLTPVSLFGVTQNVVVVHPSLPAKSAKELIALLKASPGKYNMASAGAGSQSHLAGVQFMLASGTDAVHVPYKGGGASVAATVSNEAQFTITPLAATLTFIRSGQLRALGTAGVKRSAQLPDSPTLGESALPGFQSTGWVGVLVPRGTPRPITERLHAAIVQVMKQLDTQEQMVRAGADPVWSTPEEFAKLIREEWDRFKLAITAAKLAIE
ncbi:MAG: tripartite tricarboxylate transporter substrate binding protein [Proteobacteria bacterium]|nr:tripartite tricarboxylate transporter substrate binding protein [Burkholderiales bacterium]